MEAALDDEVAVARQVTLDLSFKNQHHVLTLPASTPLLDIQALAEDKTGIAPAHQKLIHKGKTLTDPTTTLCQLGGETGTVKLVLIGTTAAVLAALAEAPKQVGNVRIINDLGSTGGSGSRGVVPILRSRRYGFQRVDVLPHLPEQERARHILTELASDPGVLHVMEKYQWSVGALCEMYPEGLVGVSSVCVMGLNENKGQRILLRLRTDDLQGWRKVLSVRKVLYHEMAHNIHSDHDDQFHILMRTIEREVNAFNNSGRAISGSTYIQADSTAWGPAAFSGGSGRLGGASADLTQVLPARVMAGHAAMQRLSEEEQAIEDACASGRHATPTLPTLPPPHHHTGSGCCDNSSSSSCSSSSSPVVVPGQQEGEGLHSSLPPPHHSEPLPVEVEMLPAAEEEGLPALEMSSLPPAASSAAAQAPPTLLSTNPWADAAPAPAVQNGNEKKDIIVASPLQPTFSTSPPEVPVSTAADGEEQKSLPLSPPPDELTTITTTQRITVADTDRAAIAMDDATEQLLGLGFAEVEVRRALQECGGDVMHAADYLLLLAAAEEDRGGGGGGGMDSANNDNAAAAAAAAVIDSAFAPPPDSRQARVMEAVQRLVQQTRGEPEAGMLAFTTLQSMLQTLLDHPQEPKYKRVRLGNAKFQRAVGRFPPAMDLLRAVGFEEREGGTVLEYTRNDPGLLWWGKSAVEGAQEQAGEA